MVKVLDVTLFEENVPKAVDIVLAVWKQESKQNRLISATGAHGIVTARQDADFRQILDAFYLNLPDGMPSVWIGRWKGAKSMQRCYGPDFFRDVMISSKDLPIHHFLCGGKKGVAEELKRVCERKFGNSQVVGVYSPPFREMSDDEIERLADEINQANVDIVWIGLSTPKQERFALRLSKYTRVHFLCTVGAAFDFHVGLVKQAPSWMQKAGLEWLFRLIVEPKRLWKRYLKIVPLFMIYNIVDLIHNQLSVRREAS